MHINNPFGREKFMLFDFSNKKKTKRIAAIICGVLVFAMVVGLLVSAI